ncbi:hypothetical protein HK405_011948, partial [Cladochytrium tenue]
MLAISIAARRVVGMAALSTLALTALYPAALALPVGPPGAAVAAADPTSVTSLFVGSGTIQVLNSTSYVTAGPADAVGCLTQLGQLTADLASCAVFDAVGADPNSGVAAGIASADGNCTFWDATAPKNVDSYYGAIGNALRCEDHQLTVADSFYTI